MTQDALVDGLRSLIRTTANIAERLTSPSIWVPTSGSPGEAEFNNSESGPAGLWGHRPVGTAYAAACIGVKAATEYARAVEAMVGSVRSALAPETMARTALEAAASAWWLLEPELGARRRVCRLQLVRIKSAVELDRAIAEIGVSDASGAFGETPDRVGDYSRQLGLGRFLDRGQDQAAVCETETRPRYTQRVNSLLDEWGVKGAYRLYSGTAHAELYALIRHFEHAEAPLDSGERVLDLTVRPTGLQAATHAVLLAMIAPLERAGLLFGWHADDGPGAELSITIDYVNARLADLTPAS